MRQYKKEKNEILKLEKIICNKCGKEILIISGSPAEDVLEVQKRWGYFSAKDNRRDHFEVCEACYDEWTAGFSIPVESEEL